MKVYIATLLFVLAGSAKADDFGWTVLPRIATDDPFVGGTACDTSNVQVDQEIIGVNSVKLTMRFEELRTQIQHNVSSDRQSCAIRVRAVAQPGMRFRIVGASVQGSAESTDFVESRLGLATSIDGQRTSDELFYPRTDGTFNFSGPVEQTLPGCAAGRVYTIGANAVPYLARPIGSGHHFPEASLSVTSVELILRHEPCIR